MASRSMNYLRKHAKVITVIMGIVLMITFVVGAALTDITTSARYRAEHPNPVVVTWTKGKVTQDELRGLQFRHARVIDFLERIIVATIQRGGKPVINGQPVTLDRQFQIGISRNLSEEATVNTMVMAAEADRLGVAVDVQAAKDFLRQISAPELKEGDWLDIGLEVIGKDNRLSVNQLLEHLAYELKAQHMRSLAMTGMYAQSVGPIVPPGEAYELFCRLNRRFTIDAYPVEVEGFVDLVKGQPTDAELQKLFDEGKNRDPDPNVDEPGFRKPHKLAFKWLKVDFTPFLDEAKKQITEEQIEEAYQKDISQGLHKALELPPAEKKDPMPPEAEKADAEKPATETPAEKKPQTDKPAEPAQESDKPAESKTNAPKADDKPATKPDDSGDCGQETQPPQESPAKSAEKSAADNRPEAKPADAKPAEEKPNAEKTSEQKASEQKPSDDKPAAADADKPATSPPAAATDATPAAEPKYKPLSEVREEILTRLARPIAEDARKAAVAEVVSAIERYGKAYRHYQAAKSVNLKKAAEVKPPEKLDLAPLAAKHNFPIGETPLVDQYEVAKTEIGQKVQQFDIATAQMTGQIRMLSFADLAFGQDQPLFRPEEVRSSEPDVSYIYFRTAEEKAADVTLKEVRDQVVAFWKQRQAFDLALAEAKKLAEKAKGAESLAAAVPDATKVITTPPFSWMTTGGFGFGQPEFSQVAGIELAGREFMQGVFSLNLGETGVAPNQSHRKVYVVRVLTQDPDEERLRTQFLESGYNQMVLMLAQGEALQTSVEWYRNIADQYKVKWERPPQDERRI